MTRKVNKHVPGPRRQTGYSYTYRGIVECAQALCGDWHYSSAEAVDGPDDPSRRWAVPAWPGVDDVAPEVDYATVPIAAVTCPRCIGRLLGKLNDMGLLVRVDGGAP